MFARMTMVSENDDQTLWNSIFDACHLEAVLRVRRPVCVENEMAHVCGEPPEEVHVHVRLW